VYFSLYEVSTDIKYIHHYGEREGVLQRERERERERKEKKEKATF